MTAKADETRRRRSGRRDEPGLLSVVAGALLLIVVGFGAGVVAGLVLEDPGLVIDYALGRTEGVELESEALAVADAELPPVAAAPPSAIEPSERATPPVGAAPPSGRFAVQVGAFEDAAAAQRLAERLRGRGLDVYVSPSAEPGASRWRVRVGPVASREQAETLAGRLKKRERLPTWVLTEGPG